MSGFKTLGFPYWVDVALTGQIPSVKVKFLWWGISTAGLLGQRTASLEFHPRASSHLELSPEIGTLWSLHLMSLTLIHPPPIGQEEVSRNVSLFPTFQRRLVTLRIKSELQGAANKPSPSPALTLRRAPPALALAAPLLPWPSAAPLLSGPAVVPSVPSAVFSLCLILTYVISCFVVVQLLVLSNSFLNITFILY